MTEHMVYSYALGYHHAVAIKALDTEAKQDNGLSGELRKLYDEGFSRGVMDNRIDAGVMND